MLIVALVMAVIAIAALATAVVTSNVTIAWVCIGASLIGVVLLIVDALRERQRADAEAGEPQAEQASTEIPDERPTATIDEVRSETVDEADAETHHDSHTDVVTPDEPAATENAIEDSGEGERQS